MIVATAISWSNMGSGYGNPQYFIYWSRMATLQYSNAATENVPEGAKQWQMADVWFKSPTKIAFPLMLLMSSGGGVPSQVWSKRVPSHPSGFEMFIRFPSLSVHNNSKISFLSFDVRYCSRTIHALSSHTFVYICFFFFYAVHHVVLHQGLAHEDPTRYCRVAMVTWSLERTKLATFRPWCAGAAGSSMEQHGGYLVKKMFKHQSFKTWKCNKPSTTPRQNRCSKRQLLRGCYIIAVCNHYWLIYRNVNCNHHLPPKLNSLRRLAQVQVDESSSTRCFFALLGVYLLAHALSISVASHRFKQPWS